jgi:hypothetical protein
MLIQLFDSTRAVHTNGDLLLRKRVLGREEPEEQLIGVLGVRTDGEETGIGFPNVEIHIRQRTPIDGEFYTAVSPERTGAAGRDALLDCLFKNSSVTGFRGASLVGTRAATDL